jgi:peptidoglycan-associated lipoprotein
MNKLLIAACITLAGCASSTPAPIAERTQSNYARPDYAQQRAEAGPQTGQLSRSEIDGQSDESSVQQSDAKSVYFDYNSFEIKPEYNNVIQQQVIFMRTHPAEKISLAGNTDERGSNEFNLALGDKRALAVKKRMLASGILQSRINAISYGEEKPRLTCHEERCWMENRRVDFMHQMSYR